MPNTFDTEEDALKDENLQEALARQFIDISGNRVTYHLKQRRQYQWSDPEEWVRARTLAYLVVNKGYPPTRMRTEVQVPRRTPSDWADIVVYEDDNCSKPYIVVENKSAGQNSAKRAQGIEQGFGNANSLRAPFLLYDEHTYSFYFDVSNFSPMERKANRLGSREIVPEQYGDAPIFRLYAGGPQDIEAVSPSVLESKIRLAHSIIWAGGRRDPLTAFNEWSNVLFAKVIDERRTPTGSARLFQIGSNETTAAVSNRIHRLFAQGCRDDTTIFSTGTRIALPDRKVFDVVETIQDISFVRTDVDSIGKAF